MEKRARNYAAHCFRRLEGNTFLYDEGSSDETLPLQTGMQGYKNDELVEGEVNWTLIPSAR